MESVVKEYILKMSGRHRLKKSERVGFEPTVPRLRVRVLSRDVPSATQPSFQRRAILACIREFVNLLIYSTQI